MKTILVIFFILCNGLIHSQDQGIQLPEELGGPFVYKVSMDRILKTFDNFEKYSFEELTPKSKWWYHLTVSSCRLYLYRDSSLYHFEEAYKIMPKTTCEEMRVRHNTFIKALEKEREEGIVDGYLELIRKETGKSKFSWYLWDLPDFDEFAFIDSCNLKYPMGNAIKDTTNISETIRKRDQKNRNNFIEQQPLDKMNREFIDSLYLLKGTLAAFTKEEIYQFSMVAHHSEDCDWAYKWMERLIDHYVRDNNSKMLLGPLLERMLSPKDGYCTKQDPQKRAYFIYMIKDKHPEFFDKMRLNWEY